MPLRPGPHGPPGPRTDRKHHRGPGRRRPWRLRRSPRLRRPRGRFRHPPAPELLERPLPNARTGWVRGAGLVRPLEERPRKHCAPTGRRIRHRSPRRRPSLLRTARGGRPVGPGQPPAIADMAYQGGHKVVLVAKAIIEAVLRDAPAPLVLRGLLRRRAGRTPARPAVPGGLRRDRRRSSQHRHGQHEHVLACLEHPGQRRQRGQADPDRRQDRHPAPRGPGRSDHLRGLRRGDRPRPPTRGLRPLEPGREGPAHPRAGPGGGPALCRAR